MFHIEEGEDGFEKLCKKYPYIAISIPELRIVLKGKSNLNKVVTNLIRKANKINPKIKIHLLGCTQQNLMMQKGYYSCDSTSWLSPGRWGRALLFDGQKLVQVHSRNKEWLNYRERERDGIYNRAKDIPQNEYNLNVILSGKSYKQFNRYINNKYYNYEPLKILK